jgi:hypothetical protein
MTLHHKVPSACTAIVHHHIYNKKNGGGEERRNKLRIKQFRHNSWHNLFGDKTIRGAIILLLRLDSAKRKQCVN